jgi:hypothetical protein
MKAVRGIICGGMILLAGVAGADLYSYNINGLNSSTAGSGTALHGQDNWTTNVAMQAGSTVGAGVRSAVTGVFVGKTIYLGGTSHSAASRVNDGNWGYSIGSSDTTLSLSAKLFAGGARSAVVGLGCDADADGLLYASETAGERGEVGFIVGYSGASGWTLYTGARSANYTSTSTPMGSGDTYEIKFEINLTANAGDGSGSLYVRQVNDYQNDSPVPAEWTAVSGLQNIDMDIQSMVNGTLDARDVSNWNGIMMRAANTGGISDSIVIESIPEPATMGLFGVALAGLLALRRLS